MSSSAFERAQCQCSVDGLSGGEDVLYNALTKRLYTTKNTETGGTYKFIGCGAHTRYRDDYERQIGGYPWRFCYTYGGKSGCRITETSQKHSLNNAIAYRFCNGYYDCNAQAHRRVRDGTGALFHTLTLDEFDVNGLLQDWSNCCKECRLYGANCSYWDFSVETMACRLFSTTSHNAVEQEKLAFDGGSDEPYWYVGDSGGFDDAPLQCWRRNKYDTCPLKGPRVLFVCGAIVLPGLSLVLFFLIKICNKNNKVKLGLTNDVTPGYSRTASRVRSTKGGTETYQVTVYPATIVYKTRGSQRTKQVERDGREFRRDQELFFEYMVDDSNYFQLLTLERKGWFGCRYCCPVFLLLLGLGCTFFLSLQVFLTSGGRYKTKYLLPGEGSTVTWGVFMILSAVLFVPVSFAWCYDMRKRRTIDDDDKFDKNDQKNKAGRYDEDEEVGD
ncbi:hypothetical protein ACA910_019829 [Epithemia clementina (nom. ined.)]